MLELSIGLTVDDVAGLPGYGKTTFGLGGDGVQPELFASGLRRIMEYYVLGMHAAYGLSNFAEPTPFLLLLRQLADTVYDAWRAATGHSVLVDTSEGNAALEPIIRALYPEAFEPTQPGTGSPRARTAVGERASSNSLAPVIVVGCPRSGTTWLQRMLQSHPSLAGPDGETCLFTSVSDLLANPALDRVLGRAAVVSAARTFGAGLCAHWQAQHAPDAARLVEKTPSNVDHLDVIAELFPESSIIGIYRDGRDVVASMLAVPFAPDDPASATRGWVGSVRKMQRFAARSDQIRVVRYEELRADPVGQVVALLEWLGLATGDAVRATLTEKAGAQVSQHRQGDEAPMAARDERAVYRLGGELLVELGYATDAEVRAVKRQPGNVLDLARRGAARLVRNR